MSTGRIKSVCFFGGFEAGYPRSEVLRKGLEKHGVTVHMCRTSPKRRGIVRAVLLTHRFLTMKRPFPVVYVPEFRHKDVPLAYVLTRITRKRLIFDPLVSRFDTKILDRRDAGEASVQAWHNRNLDWISLRLPDTVLADTKSHADYYVAEFGVASDKVRVLPVGFDDDLFDFRRQKTGDAGGASRFNVLFFGNYLPLHGVDVIVSAAKELKDVTGIRFDLIGEGQTFPVVERYVTTHHLDNVRLLPRIPMGALPEVISRADVCLGVFGRTEKASRVVANKVFQAMAMGRPVISADSPAMREHFVDSQHVCLVPVGDGKELADKIRYLFENPGIGREIGLRAAKYVHERFTSRAVAGTFLAYAEELCQA